MIHVCFGLHDKTGRYSKFTGTTILSLFENTNSDATAHILHDNTLTQENRDKFIYLAGRYGQTVKFYNVEKLCAETLAEIISLAPDSVKYGFTVGALYRLLVTQLLPKDIDKIIYLDSDIVVNLDINELWQINLGYKILAAVPEILSYKTIEAMKPFFRMCKDGIVKYEDYFNSGVVVMNLNDLRNEEKVLMDGFSFIVRNPFYSEYPDQNILNYCFSTETVKLPTKFNRYAQDVRFDKEAISKKIYHYAAAVSASDSVWT